MSLQQQLDSFKTVSVRTAPAGRAALYDAKVEELRANFVLDSAIGLGDPAPDFHLSDPNGRAVLLRDLLQAGPAVVTLLSGRLVSLIATFSSVPSRSTSANAWSPMPSWRHSERRERPDSALQKQEETP